MKCLAEDTVLAFCSGELAGGDRAHAEGHIAACDECRALVSAVVRSSFVVVGQAGADGAGEGGQALTEAPASLEGAGPSTDVAFSATRPASAASAHAFTEFASVPVRGDAQGAAPAGLPLPVSPGDLLAGKYQVERVIGAGGMGVVVAARHTHLEQKVALKFLLPHACEVPGAVSRFLREGKAAARITSEHVARVIDTGMLDMGAPFLVMEYLEGADLGAIANARGPLPPAEAIDYVLQACEAIVEAHELGVIHRDLKPANLFLSRRADGSPLVKVLDFGISKVEGGGSRSHVTTAAVLMGSPRYMSPEQMVSARDVDARTDVWALGVILFELVAGRPVWEADTVQGLCALIASAPAPRLRTYAPSAPALLDDVVGGCLVKARDDRLGSVAELALALEPIAPASARTSIDRILRVAKRARARGDEVGLAMAGPSIGPPSLAPVGGDATVQTGPSLAVQPSPARRMSVAVAAGALTALAVVGSVALLVRGAGREPVAATLPVPPSAPAITSPAPESSFATSVGAPAMPVSLNATAELHVPTASSGASVAVTTPRTEPRAVGGSPAGHFVARPGGAPSRGPLPGRAAASASANPSASVAAPSPVAAPTTPAPALQVVEAPARVAPSPAPKPDTSHALTDRK